MATRTFTTAGVNNLWTNALNWDTAPVDNDAVIIPVGQTCEFDADMSNAGTWPNGIAGITVTGTLTYTRTTGSYYLKIKAGTTISGAGTVNNGTLVNPIPFPAKHITTGGADWYIQGSGGLTMTVYAAEPTYPTVLLSGAEAALSTRLEINTNLTGDIWAVGDTIHIDNINKDVQSETRIISAITSTYIDITVGLTASKLAGSIVSLITRNTQIVSVGISQPTFQNFATAKLTIAGGAFIGSNYRMFSSCTGVTISGGTFSGNIYGLYSCAGVTISGGTFSGNTSGLIACTGATISGGTFSGNTSGLNSCTGVTISGGTFSGNTYGLTSCTGATISGGTFSGNTYGLNSCTGATISGGTFSGNTSGLTSCTGATISGGTFSGNNMGLNSCTGATISGGTFSGNTYGLYFCTGVTISGGTFSGNTSGLYMNFANILGGTFISNTYDIRRSIVNLWNVTLTSSPDNFEYALLNRVNYSPSINHGGVAGAFKSWTTGGITTSVATPVPTGYVRSYQIALESATLEGFWQREILVPAGKTVSFSMWIRKSASMSYKPRCWIFLDTMEPFLSGTPLKESIYPDDTNDTWWSDTYTYTNSDNYDKTLIARFLGMNATGYVYTQISTYFSGISRSRVLGGVG